MRVSVGVPPATVTALLRLTVSVTTLPAPRSPVPAVMPVPDATTEDTEGVVVVVSMMTPAKVSGSFAELSLLPARSAIVPLTAVTASPAVF